MRPTSILRGAAAALIVALATLSSASANHRGGHGPVYRGGAPGMHGAAYRHGREMRPPMHGGMHHRHGYGRRRDPGHHAHHGYGGRPGHYGGFAGRGFLPRPAYRHHGVYGRAFFPRPRLHRPRFHGGYGIHRRHGYGYGYGVAAFARPAYYPYSHGVSHGRGYGYIPSSGYGTVAGGSLYTPLYNRPACSCY
jgi:hypothetical protein